MKNIRLCALAACSMLLAACDGPQGLEEGFRNPSSAGVQTSVYWYWISGSFDWIYQQNKFVGV